MEIFTKNFDSPNSMSEFRAAIINNHYKHQSLKPKLGDQLGK